MTDRYLVLGNPVAHSLSPRIHAEFARATGQDMAYDRRLVPLDGFAEAVAQLRAEGIRGANVTVPFKEDAFRCATALSARAQAAAAVNTLRFDADGVFGDNTDGCGLVTDLRSNLGVALAGQRILLVGAGGAARGVLQPLLAERPAALVIANRTPGKARALAALGGAPAQASSFADLAGQRFDLVINATSASIAGEVPPLPATVFAPGAMAYDMMYGKGPGPDRTAFLAWARGHGAARLADGLGMLVEQAAEAFFVWRGVRPQTAPLLASLRA
jgi:shikimate dehydrogenase